MRVYLDTDVHCEIVRDPDLNWVPDSILDHGWETLVSEKVVEEIFLMSQPSLHRVGRSVARLLKRRELLASLKHQIEWSVPLFLSDPHRAFEPMPAYKSQAVLSFAVSPDPLPKAMVDELRRHRDAGIERWDEMHLDGRPPLQSVLQSGLSVPDAREWMEGILESEFTDDIVLGMLSPVVQRSLRGRVPEFVLWHPLCRCFVEQLLLAIRRHGLLHPTASSRKGPKWHDYDHGAYVGVVDLFVTNDARFRTALAEHRAVRDAPSWEISDLGGLVSLLRLG